MFYGEWIQDTLKADINDSFLLIAHTCSAYAQRVTVSCIS